MDLEAAGLEVLRSPLGRPYGEAELIEGLRGVFATVAGIEPYTERVLREATDLEVIARFGVGYDQIRRPGGDPPWRVRRDGVRRKPRDRRGSRRSR
jgi:phosphoglycerate dehydrogenase-like enzyme